MTWAERLAKNAWEQSLTSDRGYREFEDLIKEVADRTRKECRKKVTTANWEDDEWK